jgi:hypothetical protein
LNLIEINQEINQILVDYQRKGKKLYVMIDANDNQRVLLCHTKAGRITA